ncbi:MAG: hypothetical protein ACFFC7_23640, partial [Candidatus Hermodarchaeota archaeon]
KVLFDPTISASAECSNNLLQFYRQNARWAEGHTRYFRKHFWDILKNNFLSIREKLEFLFLGTMYINTTLVVTITVGGVLVMMVDPYLTYSMNLIPTVVGILFTILGLLSIVLADIVALVSEGSSSDIPKIPYALVLGYITTPVTAYSAIKGFFTEGEHFYRTYKTGKITKMSIIDYLKEVFKNRFSSNKC